MRKAALALAGLCALTSPAALSADPPKSADARLAAAMRGCWDLIPQGKLALHAEKMAEQGWQFSYSVCFGGAPRGEMLTWTSDAGDGWDGSKPFELVDGRLILSWSSTAGMRCDVRADANHLAWTTCVNWTRKEGIGLVDGEATEPSTFVRDPDFEKIVFGDPRLRDWLPG